MAQKISDILWDAANKHLWDGRKSTIYLGTEDIYSCFAASIAEGRAIEYSEACRFLRKLGVKTSCAAGFDKFEYGEERQGARYLWLMFAYLVALDEGL